MREDLSLRTKDGWIDSPFISEWDEVERMHFCNHYLLLLSLRTRCCLVVLLTFEFMTTIYLGQGSSTPSTRKNGKDDMPAFLPSCLPPTYSP